MINIRNMELSDIDKAAKIFEDSFNSVGEMWNFPTCIERIKQYYTRKSCWVAEINNKIVGFLTSKEDNVVDHKELYIDVIAVDPQTHKQGIGRVLIKTAESYAKAQGYTAIWLSASTDLFSYNWYIKDGFKQTKWSALVKEI